MADARKKTTIEERKEIVEYCISHNRLKRPLQEKDMMTELLKKYKNSKGCEAGKNTLWTLSVMMSERKPIKFDIPITHPHENQRYDVKTFEYPQA